jgi:hypothetical protein
MSSEGESKVVEVNGVRVTVRFIGRKARKGRIAIEGPAGRCSKLLNNGRCRQIADKAHSKGGRDYRFNRPRITLVPAHQQTQLLAHINNETRRSSAFEMLGLKVGARQCQLLRVQPTQTAAKTQWRPECARLHVVDGPKDRENDQADTITLLARPTLHRLGVA